MPSSWFLEQKNSKNIVLKKLFFNKSVKIKLKTSSKTFNTKTEIVKSLKKILSGTAGITVLLLVIA